MKRALASVCALFWALALTALPARRGGVQYIQPDGSRLEIFLHGDEWGHWVTDREGRLLDVDADGFYRLSTRSLSQVRREVARQGRLLRRQRDLKLRASSVDGDKRTVGSHRVPVVLVEFQDKEFSVAAPRTAFLNMLGQKGYDVGGATGSVWDFFNDNSHGLYNPIFEVFGPVKLSKNMAAYGKNNADTGRDQFPGPELALVEACTKLDSEMDFSLYDENLDGEVDMILFYFAGYDEAEGGPSDAIWSHQWHVQSSPDQKARSTVLDGVRLGSYFCTSELSGSSGTVMGGIGSTVHEFSHHLGLPDFYDTDEQENGYASGLYYFSTMSNGLYNNEGRTPPYFNTEELRMLDWLEEDAVKDLPDGEVSLPGIWNREAFRIPTSTEGEYFLVEYRDGTGWDAPLPRGLAIYHADHSERIVLGDYTARYLWDGWRGTNLVNAVGEHPCFYIIPSSAPASLDYGGGAGGVLFPGTSKVSSFQPIDWENVLTSQQLTAIRLDGDRVHFTVRSDEGKNINGLVVDTSGNPLKGAEVSVEPIGLHTVTDEKGYFFLSLLDVDAPAEVEVTVRLQGYVARTLPLVLQDSGNNLFIMIRKEGEADVSTLDKSNPSAQLMSYSASGRSLMGAVRFTAEELSPYVGERLTTVTFYPVVYSAEQILVLVERGGERILEYPVPNPVYAGWNTVDISAFDLRVPEGEDLYIGYAVRGGDYDHPLSCRYARREPTDSYYAVYSPSPTSWRPMAQYDLALAVTVSEVLVPTSLADIGYNSIDPGPGIYKAGNRLDLRLREAFSRKPASVSWFYDGDAVTGTSVTLAAGVHTVEARLEYENGSTEVLEMEIEVK